MQATAAAEEGTKPFRTIQVKVRVDLLPDCQESARRVATVIRSAIAMGLTQETMVRHAYEAVTLIEPAEIRLPEKWVSARGVLGAHRVPEEVATVMRRAIARVRKSDPKALGQVDGWRALELICADFLAGPGSSPQEEP